jgi:non-ribosomal peptide synthase protein (TIGR01720 family)
MTSLEERERVLQRLAGLSPRGIRSLREALQDEVGAPPQLTAFLEVDPEVDGEGVDEADLRAHLGEELPDYMIPARYVVVDRLPRTTSGKLNRGELSGLAGRELEPARPGGLVSPRNEREEALLRIWQDVLGMDEIGVHDDFFEIGGDSLLSIRVISRAAREGIPITPADFFEAPTIARLAATDRRPGAAVEQGVVTGTAPLTPIQHWFFERIVRSRDHWNQALLLVPPSLLDAEGFERAIAELVRHHDALRTRFVVEDGVRRQVVRPPTDQAPVRTVDMTSVEPQERGAQMQEEGTRSHAGLSLESGPLFEAVFFDGGSDFRRVLLVAHHLIVDAISWTVILDDLSALVSGGGAAPVPDLPRKTASVLAWAHALSEAAARDDVRDAVAVWTGPEAPAAPDRPPASGGPSSPHGPTGPETVEFEVSAADTARFLDAVAAHPNSSRQQALLATVAVGWHRWSGRREIRVDVEGHGRDILSGSLDVSRTVGWFTTVFPLVLDVGTGSLREATTAVRQAFAALPFRGGSHGMLRYLCPDPEIRDRLAGRPHSELLFNYLGAADGPLPPDSLFEIASEPTGAARAPGVPPAYGIELNASLQRGRLVIRTTFDPTVHAAREVDELLGFIEVGIEEFAGGAEDAAQRFDLAGLDADGLDRVADLLADIDQG